MRSPFRRRRKRPRRSAATPPQQEVVDWPKDGRGGGGLMSAIRGDSDSGAGFGPGMFADLQAAFGGSGKQIQLEEQEKEKLLRHELHAEAGGSKRDDLESGTIRITKRREQPDEPGRSGEPDEPGATD